MESGGQMQDWQRLDPDEPLEVSKPYCLVFDISDVTATFLLEPCVMEMFSHDHSRPLGAVGALPCRERSSTGYDAPLKNPLESQRETAANKPSVPLQVVLAPLHDPRLSGSPVRGLKASGRYVPSMAA